MSNCYIAELGQNYIFPSLKKQERSTLYCKTFAMTNLIKPTF